MIKFKNQLVWPSDVGHTKQRKKTKAKTTWLSANFALEKIMRQTGIKNVVVYANLNIICGEIHSRRSDIHGVAVAYLGSKGRKIAYCDQYFKESDNLMAIAKTLRSYNEIKNRKVGIADIPEGTQQKELF